MSSQPNCTEYSMCSNDSSELAWYPSSLNDSPLPHLSKFLFPLCPETLRIQWCLADCCNLGRLDEVRRTSKQ